LIYIYVGIAGALGAIARYGIGVLLLTNSLFPWATLVTNLAGSFLLAWVTTFLFKKIPISPVTAKAISTGFIGSFTTFSTLSVETIEMFEGNQVLLGIVYVFASMVGGILLGRLGFKMGKEGERA